MSGAAWSASSSPVLRMARVPMDTVCSASRSSSRNGSNRARPRSPSAPAVAMGRSADSGRTLMGGRCAERAPAPRCGLGSTRLLWATDLGRPSVCACSASPLGHHAVHRLTGVPPTSAGLPMAFPGGIPQVGSTGAVRRVPYPEGPRRGRNAVRRPRLVRPGSTSAPGGSPAPRACPRLRGGRDGHGPRHDRRRGPAGRVRRRPGPAGPEVGSARAGVAVGPGPRACPRDPGRLHGLDVGPLTDHR
jgi:hypothetical protein